MTPHRWVRWFRAGGASRDELMETVVWTAGCCWLGGTTGSRGQASVRKQGSVPDLCSHESKLMFFRNRGASESFTA